MRRYAGAHAERCLEELIERSVGLRCWMEPSAIGGEARLALCRVERGLRHHVVGRARSPTPLGTRPPTSTLSPATALIGLPPVSAVRSGMRASGRLPRTAAATSTSRSMPTSCRCGTRPAAAATPTPSCLPRPSRTSRPRGRNPPVTGQTPRGLPPPRARGAASRAQRSHRGLRRSRFWSMTTLPLSEVQAGLSEIAGKVATTQSRPAGSDVPRVRLSAGTRSTRASRVFESSFSSRPRAVLQPNAASRGRR